MIPKVQWSQWRRAALSCKIVSACPAAIAHFFVRAKMKIALFICGGAVLGFFVLAFLFHELQTRTPAELKRVSNLLSEHGRLLSWANQPIGWLGKFEVHGRRFDISSHRGDVEIVELVGSTRRLVGTDGPKSPQQIYDLLTKAVA